MLSVSRTLWDTITIRQVVQATTEIFQADMFEGISPEEPEVGLTQE